MKEFLGKEFVLKTSTAQTLYYDYAQKMPIFDFHCHLPIQEIYEDKKFRSITEAWLGGDHSFSVDLDFHPSVLRQPYAKACNAIGGDSFGKYRTFFSKS